jgi:hypothetical protein
MKEHIDWNDSYRDGNLPWDTGRPAAFRVRRTIFEPEFKSSRPDCNFYGIGNCPVQFGNKAIQTDENRLTCPVTRLSLSAGLLRSDVPAEHAVL